VQTGVSKKGHEKGDDWKLRVWLPYGIIIICMVKGWCHQVTVQGLTEWYKVLVHHRVTKEYMASGENGDWENKTTGTLVCCTNVFFSLCKGDGGELVVSFFFSTHTHTSADF